MGNKNSFRWLFQCGLPANANGAAAQPHPAARGGAKPRSAAQGRRLQARLGGAARDARRRLGRRRSVARARWLPWPLSPHEPAGTGQIAQATCVPSPRNACDQRWDAKRTVRCIAQLGGDSPWLAGVGSQPAGARTSDALIRLPSQPGQERGERAFQCVRLWDLPVRGEVVDRGRQ